ncbi:MAG: alpha/beta hydrolase [Chloroflexota bacterium]|nr:alpha/beta hydrolase [Chloroflexota bacterium]
MVAPVRFHDLGSGPPLLLVHGGFSDGSGAWAAQMESLRRHHRLLVPDRRGHGASPKEPRPYTIRGDALDMLDVATRAGGGSFHLAGHSYGGLVALEAAILAPERILSLHLIEPPYLALLPCDPDVRALNGEVRHVMEQGQERGPEWAATMFFRAIAGAAAVERLSRSRRWPDIVGEGERILYEEYAGDYPRDRVGRLRVRGPVQIYTGSNSHPALRKLAARLSKLIEQARLLEIPRAGHAVQVAGEPFDRELLAGTASKGLD